MKKPLSDAQVKAVAEDLRKIAEKYDVDFMVLAMQHHETLEMWHVASADPFWVMCAIRIKEMINRLADAINAANLQRMQRDN